METNRRPTRVKRHAKGCASEHVHKLDSWVANRILISFMKWRDAACVFSVHIAPRTLGRPPCRHMVAFDVQTHLVVAANGTNGILAESKLRSLSHPICGDAQILSTHFPSCMCVTKTSIPLDVSFAKVLFTGRQEI
jgi:hypothetical protein